MTGWYDFKLFVAHALGVSMDALHVLVGVGAQLAFALVLRTSVSAWRPWFALLVLVLLNEAWDYSVEPWPSGAMQFGEAVKDVLLTMAVPTVLLLLARRNSPLLGVAR